MTKSSLKTATRSKSSHSIEARVEAGKGRRRTRGGKEKSDVLVSAVISTYLLTHLHHVLQRAEYGAVSEGRNSQAENFAQLRKVLCMDARSMEDASAAGYRDGDGDKFLDQDIGPKVA